MHPIIRLYKLIYHVLKYFELNHYIHTNPDGSIAKIWKKTSLTIGDEVIIGDGTLIFAENAVINRSTIGKRVIITSKKCKFGDGLIIGDDSVISDDMKAGDFFRIGKRCSISKLTAGDNVTIEDDVFILEGNIYKDNVSIGKYSNMSSNITVGYNSKIHNHCIILDDVTIGNDVSIGHSSFLEKECEVADNTVIKPCTQMEKNK